MFCALQTEITHGFDDKGRQFDKDGNMMQWWNNATIRNFRERAQCIIDQYSRYRIDEVGLYMNGRMTQGNLLLMMLLWALHSILSIRFIYLSFAPLPHSNGVPEKPFLRLLMLLLLLCVMMFRRKHSR